MAETEASAASATASDAAAGPAPAPAPPVDNREVLLKDAVGFWDGIWQNEEVPKFDVQCPSPCLLKLIADGVVPPGRALVPGCGRGYDVAALAAPDREAIGLDISPTGIAAARARLAALPEGEVKGKCQFELASFFTYSSDEKFTLIYDYTFLCALPPEQRGEWAAQMKALLAPETGLLITLIYPISETKPGGPPFAMSFALLKSLLEPLGFTAERLEHLPAELSHPGRDGTGNWGATSGIGLWRLVA